MILTWGLESYNEALKVLEGSDHPKVRPLNGQLSINMTGFGLVTMMQPFAG